MGVLHGPFCMTCFFATLPKTGGPYLDLLDSNNTPILPPNALEYNRISSFPNRFEDFVDL